MNQTVPAALADERGEIDIEHCPLGGATVLPEFAQRIEHVSRTYSSGRVNALIVIG
jgi:hypothetical protein